MEKLYHETNKLIHEIEYGFNRIQNAMREDAHTIENEVYSLIEQISSNCERLEIMVNKEPPNRKQNAKLRLDKLKYDCQHYQAALQNIQSIRLQRDQDEQRREELLSRRFTTNDEASITIDAELDHNSSLLNTHRDIDDLTDHGIMTLQNIRDQRGVLKAAHKKMLDVGNVLGLSNTVIRLIEKRGSQDKYILLVGMLVTCVIMYLSYKYLL
ncbi:Golgi SNAP receptor complex member 2-like [Apostichopus japonicus]|uniref:Golgi SNAP receptor complex member 2-like n=1 Tax=Stichopus japonicus TaxID=307972 RepID=UPI003AB41CCB